MYHMIVEQTKEYKNRMEYDPIHGTFHETSFLSLFHHRNVLYPYGWIKESGTPPDAHLDVILLSKEDYCLGDEVAVKIIGCFVRNDGDNKLIAVLPERDVNNYDVLPDDVKADLHRLYPRVNDGEGWYGAAKADEIIKQFLLYKKRR